MPLYESVFIARQEVAQTQVEALAEQFAEVVAKMGGQVSKKEYWGLRNLQYRIKKNRKGHYLLLNIDAPAPAVAEMERTMRINEDVLRYLTVRVEKLDPGQSAILTARERDGERGERGGFGDRPRRERFGDRGDRGGFGGRDGDRPRRDRDDRPPRDAAPRDAGPAKEGA